MLTFNTNGMILQRFAFKAPIMDYIFKNAKPEHLIKFYQCAKYFYAKYRLNIIQHLQIVPEHEAETFDPTSTSICISNPALQKLQDFWITDSVIHRGPNGILPLFSHCTIKKLELLDYILWEEFVCLTKAGTIKDLKIKGVYGGETLYTSIEKIIACVPNATSIEISESFITSTTWNTLASSNHNVKLSNFVLQNITHFRHCNPVLILAYLNNIVDPDCNVRLDFQLFPEENFFLVEEVRELNESLKSFEFDFKETIEVLLEKKKIIALEESMEIP
uniref:RNA polymerase alpha subunit n=1 Tax=Panagrolaimus davidi TaxID=227884 RepID=A0A914PKY6_9BILA